MIAKLEFTPDQLQQIHESALQVLSTLGLSIENDEVVETLRRQGHPVRGRRVHFEPPVVEETLRALAEPFQTPLPEELGPTIGIGVCDMPQYYRCPYSGATRLMTVADLTQATKFLESLSGVRVWPMVPGVPRDVPPQVQSITEYYIGARYSSGGGNADTMGPEEALPWLLEMAESQGRPFTVAGMHTISPLRIGGFEFDLAVQYRDRFQGFHVTGLPLLGVGAPIFPQAAWATATAEALGAATALYHVTGGKPVGITVSMFPFDLRSLTMAGGASEYVLLQYQAFQITRRYSPRARFAYTISTSAKHPGVQAGMEKAMGSGLAVALGCRDLCAAGMLSFDDILSPEQMIADVELRDRLEKIIAPKDMPPDLDLLDVVRDGLDRGYMASAVTAAHYADISHHSTLFRSRSLHEYLRSPNDSDDRDALRGRAIECIESYRYEPHPDKLEAVTRLFHAAWEYLAPGVPNPFAEHAGAKGQTRVAP